MSDTYSNNMPRNEAEAQRLDEQFELTTQNIGYLIHPAIRATLPPTARIADIATGTGVFLQQVAASYPDATLHGSDISTALFPPAASLLPNMQLSRLDVLEPVPESLVGTYDLVHVRLIVAGLLPSSWSSVVQNLSRLLKPGGAMQWEECNFGSAYHMRGGETSTTSAARQLGKIFRDGIGSQLQHGWDALEQNMVSAGLVNVGHDYVSSDRIPETRKAVTRNGMTALVAFARKRSGMSSEEVNAVEEQAYKDIESGCYIRYDTHVFWGFKPEDSQSKI
ncbi:S-adenosyl-L-methionine-dependent methyltransferase [Aspergillus sclerotiicarbonarius CBS 121057]|uniref:S-adenosyl-L-methionine-dependent methyltransferase n=1 Tax=Aspergillus sclerotiicarbonarius (strain CBS 121057 / IBT 28362) TaxID=1448318 RepID=A0A319EGR4_ASPSB|nr:S-adenosyl-L-methionine-dependent methyltransferase [Aspergillus sclerotiicarbonarius CBS 121057]